MRSGSNIYTIRIEDTALKALKKIPKTYRQQIKSAIDQLRHDPYPLGHKKLTPSSFYRLRVGPYRIVYDIQRKVLKILVVHIGHRQEDYRWLKNK